MTTTTTIRNWSIGNTADVLKDIHHVDTNIYIYERGIRSLKEEIDMLLEEGIEIRASGTFDTIMNEVTDELDTGEFNYMILDIRQLLTSFMDLTGATSLRFLLATVNSNMCRRFHTDINDLRMLCTYTGPGTLWLTEDNVNREALNGQEDNEDIVLDESKIRQADTGAVVLLKGAFYKKEGTRAIVHRSPTIEESGVERLLLRIDTNGFMNF